MAGSGIGEEAYTVVTVSGSLYCTLLWVGAVDPIRFETGDVAPPAQHSAHTRTREPHEYRRRVGFSHSD